MGNLKRVGMVVLSDDATSEPDFQMVFTPLGVRVHSARMLRDPGLPPPQWLDEMHEELATASRYVGAVGLDAIAYTCTTGSFYRGGGVGYRDVRDHDRGFRRAGIRDQPFGRRSIERARGREDIGGDPVSGVEQRAAESLPGGQGIRGAEPRRPSEDGWRRSPGAGPRPRRDIRVRGRELPARSRCPCCVPAPIGARSSWSSA